MCLYHASPESRIASPLGGSLLGLNVTLCGCRRLAIGVEAERAPARFKLFALLSQNLGKRSGIRHLLRASLLYSGIIALQAISPVNCLIFLVNRHCHAR
jgi:hypothetical protein